jgi:hypothetical protein
MHKRQKATPVNINAGIIITGTVEPFLYDSTAATMTLDTTHLQNCTRAARAACVACFAGSSLILRARPLVPMHVG